MSRIASILFIALLLLPLQLAATSTSAFAQPGPFGTTQGPQPGQPRPMATDEKIPALEGIEIEDRRGAQLPADLVLSDHRGQPVRLGDYLSPGKPLVVVLAYYGCPSLCSVVVNELTKGMQSLDWTAGKEYRVLVISFDPRDGADVAAKKRDSYLGLYGRDPGEHGWDFLYGEEAVVKQVAATVGFNYKWDPDINQFAHAAGAFVFTPDGRLSRTLYGLNMGTRDFRLALVEASEGKLGTIGDKILLYCYRWDRHGNKFVLATTRLLKGAAALTVLILSVWLFTYWRKERRRAVARGPQHGVSK